MNNAPVVDTNKFLGAVRTQAVIKADDSGALPTRIQLIKAGQWDNSVKGKLTISVADLHQMKQNFDSGVGRGGNKEVGLPIDFSHNEWDKAAGWMNGLVVEGDALYADPVEWTTDGEAAVRGGMYKCISPSFYPSDRGGYTDPENYDSEAIPNTVVGAGLTNIPFFKGLSAIRADSLSESDDDDNMIFIKTSESEKEEKTTMTIEDVRVKAQADLTQDEEKFLADHKAELTDDELTKFNLKKDEPVAASTISAEDAKILADIKAGNIKVVSNEDVVVASADLNQLRETAEQYRTEKAKEVVAAHIKRGAVKADASDRWVARLLKAGKTERTDLEADLEALPSNQLLADEIGSDEAGLTAATARESLSQIAENKVKAAEKEGKHLDFGAALKAAASENADLLQQDFNDQTRGI